jgi:hypothetical protein
MSAFGIMRTFRDARLMSAFGGKADMAQTWAVMLGDKADVMR